MSEIVENVSRRYRLQQSSGRSVGFWGIILLSTTEAVLFATLLFSYYYLWSIAPEWPPGDIEPPSIWFVAIRSVILLSTSLTVWRGEVALERDDRRRVWGWIIATVLMAAFFLAGHIHEMSVLPTEFTWSDNAYGSLYYTILNFHGAHVAVGIALWLFILVRLGRGAYGPEDTGQFKTISIYWHFVDGIWVFVFSTIYLFPNLFATGG